MNKIAKKNKINKGKSKNDLDQPIITPPMIDKLSCVVKLEDQAYCKHMFHTMLTWTEDAEIGVSKASSSGTYYFAVKIRLPTTKDKFLQAESPVMLIQITHHLAGKRHARIEYNPRLLNEHSEDYLDYLLSPLGLTFYEFLHHARFTRVDWCRTIMNRSPDDYLFKAMWKKASQNVFGPDGVLRTIYMGRAGSNQITVYDKANQMHGPNSGHRVTRIEARCRINCGLLELATMKNPLNSVKLYFIGCKKPPFGTGHWRAFQDSCRLRGIGGAIKAQPAADRGKLKKVLSENAVQWWDMTDEEWEFHRIEAFENAGLTQIPDSAPPLSYKFHVGSEAA